MYHNCFHGTHPCIHIMHANHASRAIHFFIGSANVRTRTLPPLCQLAKTEYILVKKLFYLCSRQNIRRNVHYSE